MKADEFICAENIGPADHMVVNNCCSSTGSPPSTWPACESNDQANQVPSLRGKGPLLTEDFDTKLLMLKGLMYLGSSIYTAEYSDKQEALTSNPYQMGL